MTKHGFITNELTEWKDFWTGPSVNFVFQHPLFSRLEAPLPLWERMRTLARRGHVALNGDKIRGYFKMLFENQSTRLPTWGNGNVKHKPTFCSHSAFLQLESRTFRAPHLPEHFSDCGHLVEWGQILPLRQRGFSHCWKHFPKWPGIPGRGICAPES